MEPLNIMLVGCGIMGARHLRGYGELERAQPGSLRLCAVVDPRQEAAEKVAAEAQQLFGYDPTICSTLDEALLGEDLAEAADVVTDNRNHDNVAIPLLEAGINVIVEKPLGLTVRRANAIIEAARRCNRILAVAENNRRDPMNRLMQHIIQSGFIGRPRFVIQTRVSAGRQILASTWRHSIAMGGLALDVGIHQGYILEMLLGPVKNVYACSQRVWARRLLGRGDGSTEEIPVESDDIFSAVLTFESGVQGVWVMNFGSAGASQWQRIIFGDSGTAEGSVDRSGKPVRVQRGDEVFEGDALVNRLQDFKLNEIESRLFGERPGSYSLEKHVTDRKLIASEIADFINAVRHRRPPEVPGELGRRSVAVVYAILESSESGMPVELKDVISGKICRFQERVEKASLESPTAVA